MAAHCRGGSKVVAARGTAFPLPPQMSDPTARTVQLRLMGAYMGVG